MALIIMSQAALLDSGRLSDFLQKVDPEAASRARKEIRGSIKRLARHPEAFPLLDEEIRIQTIPFGKRGYSVAYTYFAESDEVLILGIKHQSEEFFPFELQEGEETDEF